LISRSKSSLLVSLLDQVLVSGVNLALTFWLINQWPPAEFGVFAIITSISMSGLAAHQALAGSQLALMTSRARDADDHRGALATTWAIALGVALLIGLATMTGFLLLGEAHGLPVAVAAGLFVGLHVCREHVRTYHFAQFEARRVLFNDLVHSLILFLALAAAVMAGARIGLLLVVGALAAASLATMLPTLLRRRSDFVLRLDKAVRRRMRRLWREHAGWALLGAGAAEMQTRGHVLAVSTFFSVTDLGIIQAALTLLRPIGVLGAGWMKVARPVMAREFAQKRPAAASRYANQSALGFVVASLGYLLVLWLAWPLLQAHVLPPDYHGLQAVVPLWGLSVLIGLLRSVYSLQAQCVPLFREAFFASALAMVTIFFGLVIAILFGTATSTVLAVAAGEGAAMIALVLIVRRHVGRAEPKDIAVQGERPSWR
jgi:O-antigen/teichoic acid export membrane protein